jgi:hypothetical protein
MFMDRYNVTITYNEEVSTKGRWTASQTSRHLLTFSTSKVVILLQLYEIFIGIMVGKLKCQQNVKPLLLHD